MLLGSFEGSDVFAKDSIRNEMNFIWHAPWNSHKAMILADELQFLAIAEKKRERIRLRRDLPPSQ